MKRKPTAKASWLWLIFLFRSFGPVHWMYFLFVRPESDDPLLLLLRLRLLRPELLELLPWLLPLERLFLEELPYLLPPFFFLSFLSVSFVLLGAALLALFPLGRHPEIVHRTLQAQHLLRQCLGLGGRRVEAQIARSAGWR